MHAVLLADDHRVPALGLGTWRMGESKRTRLAEIAAVKLAFEIGYRLIDTAEMYGDGGSEEVVGAAVRQSIDAGTLRREDLTIVSKVLPSHASREGVLRACEQSLKRLAIDTIDIYLLHWRGAYALKDTVGAFEQLQSEGRIRSWGVSNFDTADLQALWAVDSGPRCVANQIYYSATARGAEFDLMPWQREHEVATMAYSPIDQGALASDPTFAKIGDRHGVSASTAALAWVLRHPNVMAVPMSASEPHLRENFRAASLELGTDDLAQIDEKFAPPTRKRPLATT